MDQITFYQEEELIKNTSYIITKKTLYYCLHCNFHSINKSRYMVAHLKTNKHCKNENLNILRNDINKNEIMKIFLDKKYKYSLDRINWMNF